MCLTNKAHAANKAQELDFLDGYKIIPIHLVSKPVVLIKILIQSRQVICPIKEDEMKTNEVYASCKLSSSLYLWNILLTINCSLSLLLVNNFNVARKWKDCRITKHIIFLKEFHLSVIDKMLKAGDVDNKARV